MPQFTMKFKGVFQSRKLEKLKFFSYFDSLDIQEYPLKGIFEIRIISKVIAFSTIDAPLPKPNLQNLLQKSVEDFKLFNASIKNEDELHVVSYFSFCLANRICYSFTSVIVSPH